MRRAGLAAGGGVVEADRVEMEALTESAWPLVLYDMLKRSAPMEIAGRLLLKEAEARNGHRDWSLPLEII